MSETWVRVAGSEKRELSRKRYPCQPGAMRSQFPELLARRCGRQFSKPQKKEITALADELFAFANWDRKTSLLTATESYVRWKRVLR